MPHISISQDSSFERYNMNLCSIYFRVDASHKALDTSRLHPNLTFVG